MRPRQDQYAVRRDMQVAYRTAWLVQHLQYNNHKQREHIMIIMINIPKKSVGNKTTQIVLLPYNYIGRHVIYKTTLDNPAA